MFESKAHNTDILSVVRKCCYMPRGTSLNTLKSGYSNMLTSSLAVSTRDTIEGAGPCWLLKLRWMGTERVQMKGVLPWLVPWAGRADTRDFRSALVAPVSPVQIFFFSPYTLSIPLSPSPSKLGRQPSWVACLLVGVSGAHWEDYKLL